MSLNEDGQEGGCLRGNGIQCLDPECFSRAVFPVPPTGFLPPVGGQAVLSGGSKKGSRDGSRDMGSVLGGLVLPGL